MDLTNLKGVLANEPKFRYKQIDKLLYQDCITNWKEATVLPNALRERLEEECPLSINTEEVELEKGGSKILLTLHDNAKIESVLIRNSDGRYTVCVSSQVGCPMGCRFCATGAMGFKRNLSTQEIVEQVLYFARKLKAEDKRIDNVVYMGMGEPLLNIDNVLESIFFLNNKDYFNIGSRRISVSTIGIEAGIKKIAKSGLQINLAISLHASNDKQRSDLMPSSRTMLIRELLDIVDDYIEETNRQVMFEYIMLKDVNDSRENAEALAKLMDKPLYMVNLIKYNDTGTFKPSNSSRIEFFQNVLRHHRIKVTIRDSRGGEAKAACGQLANKNK